MMPTLTIHEGDCRATLKKVATASVHTCVTSPPYFNLRDYQITGQMGLEETPWDYVEQMVGLFREVRRILRDDGTLWLNLGDSYAGSWGAQSRGSETPGTLEGSSMLSARQISEHPKRTMTGSMKRFRPGAGRADGKVDDRNQRNRDGVGLVNGRKPKDLIGIPWMVAFALQADGWWLRSDIIWAKPNPMPESVTDRPTRSHEYIFLLSKSQKYYYDAGAIKESASFETTTGHHSAAARKERAAEHNKSLPTEERNGMRPDKQRGHSRRHEGFNDRWDSMEKSEQCSGMRNKRDVWTVAPANYPEAHFATFPPALIQPCILAGSPVGGVVLDPFGGSGTTGQVALELGRSAILCELNPAYVALIRERCAITPGLALGGHHG